MELLGGNTLRVVERLVVLDIRGISGGNGRRGFIDKTIGLIEGTGGHYYRRGSEDSRKEVVAFGGFNFRFRFRLLYAARHLVSRTT
jgi:hypothetical protein